MSVSAAKKREILDRRMQVSQLRLAGVRRQDLIAQQLKVSQSTMSRDFQWLDRLYTERAAEDIMKAKGLDLERLDEMIFALWQRVRAGEVEAIREARALITRRAEVLGYEAPKKAEVSGPGGGPVPLTVIDLVKMVAKAGESGTSATEKPIAPQTTAQTT